MSVTDAHSPLYITLEPYRGANVDLVVAVKIDCSAQEE